MAESEFEIHITPKLTVSSYRLMSRGWEGHTKPGGTRFVMRRERPSVVLYSRTVLLEVALSGYDTQRFRKAETTMEVRKKNQL